MFETQTDQISHMFAGDWSSPTVRGTRPPPLSAFTLTSIDNYRALSFGGGDLRPISDLYLIDFQTMVCSCCYVHHGNSDHEM